MKPFILVSLLFLLSSCVGGSYGRLQLNRDVSASFESCTVLPDYNYYYSGPMAMPNAILAIKKDQNFKKGLWNSVPVDKKQLCDWMYIIDPTHRRVRFQYDGYTLYAPSGGAVGLWYSREDRAVIKEENGVLVVYTPPNQANPSQRTRFGGDSFY